MKILVTGAAGFIGFHTAMKLCARGDDVVGLDNLNPYYDVTLKQARLDQISGHKNFSFHKIDLADRASMDALFAAEKFDRVIHLAAQAGVRYSLENVYAYIDSNLVGFTNILEGCRNNGVEHLVYASTSSVYGSNKSYPFSEQHGVDHPLTMYAATKRANELMAHSYAHIYNLPVTGLRFFTVYGPWGRPDMALFLFTKNILADEPIDIFNNGHHFRDFTYVDDIVEGVVRSADKIATPDPDWDATQPSPASSAAPFRVYNIGNSTPVPLMDLITCVEKELGREAKKNFLPMQTGDVEGTSADVSALQDAVGFHPSTPIEEGVRKFIEWYRAYYNV